MIEISDSEPHSDNGEAGALGELEFTMPTDEGTADALDRSEFTMPTDEGPADALGGSEFLMPTNVGTLQQELFRLMQDNLQLSVENIDLSSCFDNQSRDQPEAYSFEDSRHWLVIDVHTTMMPSIQCIADIQSTLVHLRNTVVLALDPLRQDIVQKMEDYSKWLMISRKGYPTEMSHSDWENDRPVIQQWFHTAYPGAVSQFNQGKLTFLHHLK
ncbi:hypothetical protein HWV62_10479 [Athelia sp. TMB]|nr:hypothetical protein HWV62_10479 [Athelia sp. TMB]